MARLGRARPHRPTITRPVVAVGNIPVNQSDTGTGTDSQSLAIASTQTDSGVGTDSQSVNTGGPATQTDSGTGTDSQSIVVRFTQTDSGSGADSQSVNTGSFYFSDAFSGAAVDSSLWTVYNRLGDQSNSELNAVTPANVTESSGTLKITGKFEDVVAGDTTTGAPNPRTVHYTSGQLAQATDSFLYGTIDVRAKIAGGTGLWPCIWMLGYLWQSSQPFTANDPANNWPNGGWWEIDIAEFLGGHRTVVNNALHFISANRSGSGEKSLPFDATTRFMVYRLVWTATSLTWLVDAEDGNGFVTTTTMTGVAGTDIPNTPGYMVLNMAIGGAGGAPDSATFPQTTEIDYVQVTSGDQAKTGTDTATGTEGTPKVAQSTSDSGAGTDSQSVNTAGNPSTQTETGTGTDSQSLAATTSQADSAGGAEGTPSIRQVLTETSTGSEGTPKVSQVSADAGAGVETWSIVVTLVQSDSGTALETEFIPGLTTQKASSDSTLAIEGWSIQVTHPAPGSPGFTKLASLTITRRLEDMSRNSRPMPGAKRWPGRRP